jgi:hypothetical protein
MRLTLRTLLAWLDDTLQPPQVKEIGRQVADSPFAQELSQRIQRVTRQRRLTVPASSGPDATDPNLVASYLDSDLDPEAVAEYEKKCLTSDVNLAEVASVHQILSLLGQKVKVPPAARARMYQLVRGREATRPKRALARRAQAPEPLTKPIAPWVVPEDPGNVWFERYGLIGVCLLLIAVAGWSAMRSLTRKPQTAPLLRRETTLADRHDQNAGAPAKIENPTASSESSEQLAATSPSEPLPEIGAGSQPGVTKEGYPPEGTPSARGAESPAAGASPAETGRAAVSKDKDSSAVSRLKEPGSLPTIPAGAAGLAEASEGILLRYDADEREWTRLLRATPLSQFDRLLSLAPFRSTITLDKIRINLVGETEVRMLSRSTDKIPVLELVSGRLLVHQPDSSSFKVGPSDRAVTVEASQESSYGLERLDRREYGQPVKRIPPLVAYCAAGDATLAVANKHDTLTPSTVLSVDASEPLRRTTVETLPTWMSDAEPSALELQLREQFVRTFHLGRPVLTEIVAASEDERPEIKQLSITALKALGDLSLLMPILSRKDDPVARKSAMAAIRAYMGLGPEAAGRLRQQLVQEFGDDMAALVEKMLVGFSSEETANPALLGRLVELLSPDQESIGVRELALDTLKRQTGRDDLGYNPDRPEGKGLNAWIDLARRGELRPLPRPARAR